MQAGENAATATLRKSQGFDDRALEVGSDGYDCASVDVLAPMAGFEPTTSALTVRRLYRWATWECVGVAQV